MNIPSLDDWTIGYVKNIIENHIVENYFFDFKKDLPNADNLTDACCAFANSFGGFIIFGVDNSNFQIVGLKFDKEFSNKFNSKLRIYPPINFSEPKFLEDPTSGKYLIIFYIHPSDNKPHVHCDQNKRRFLKRTNGGNQLMTYEEIKNLFQKKLIDELDRFRNSINSTVLSQINKDLNYKKYYIPRIISQNKLLNQQYNRFKRNITKINNSLAKSQHFNEEIFSSLVNSFDQSLTSFENNVMEDISQIKDKLNKVYLRDKYTLIIPQSISFIRSYINRDFPFYIVDNLEQIEQWIKFLEEFINEFKEEIQD